jgi:hypothetical protein
MLASVLKILVEFFKLLGYIVDFIGSVFYLTIVARLDSRNRTPFIYGLKVSQNFRILHS